jgi:hypothetical protein
MEDIMSKDMRVKTLGFIFCLIGLIGGIVAHITALVMQDVVYSKLGFVANGIQLLGLGLIYVDKD